MNQTAKTDRIMLCALLLTLALAQLTAPTSVEPTTLAFSGKALNHNLNQEVTLAQPEERAVPKALVTSTPSARTVASNLPDFAAYRDVRMKKAEFFNFMLPMIRNSNAAIRVDRARLDAMQAGLQSGYALNDADRASLASLQRKYRLSSTDSDQETLTRLLSRVDVVPASLVLAQSANESGWGTSRFAREANNLFGVWCFTPGCGLTPSARDSGLTHEVARYESVQESVTAYIHTINTNPAYKVLRRIRAQVHAGQYYEETTPAGNGEESFTSGLALAEGLLKYSARGLDYVREIQQLIRVNNLQQYTLPGRA